MGYSEPERCYIKPPSRFIHFTAGPAAPEEISPGWAAHEQQLIQGREGGLKSSKRGKGKTKFSLADPKDPKEGKSRL